MEHKIYRGLILSLAVILLNGCAGDGGVTVKNQFFGENPAMTEEMPSTEADLLVEDPENGMCLDEELSAFGQSGIWDTPMSPISVHPTDSVSSDFPIVINKQVEFYLDFFQNDHRKHFSRWLGRSTVYRAMMEKELAEAGLPLDLVYLAMIESGFNQLALSRAKAVGLWQFMAATGKQYHLRIDSHLDERRDAHKSTQAAVNYLSDLYQEFGDWHLAVAAYNGGPGRVRNGLSKHQVDNFWDLAHKNYLPLETVRYVPKLIAALLIAKEPEKYGFTDIEYLTPPQYASLSVPPGLNLDAVALISGSSVKEIKQLNQELRQNRTPPNLADYRIKIPEARLGLAEKNLARLHAKATTEYLTHTIAAGENLSQICKRYDINRTTLLKVNNLPGGKLIAGRTLRIPYQTASYSLLPEGADGAAMVARKDNLILHRVVKGDTVSAIATRYSVPVELITSWNALNKNQTIRVGQQLALYPDKRPARQDQGSVAKLNKAEHNGLPRLTVNQHKLRKPTERAKNYQVYSVRPGDSLWTISRRLGASLQDLKKWNNLKSDRLAPGDTLKILKG